MWYLLLTAILFTCSPVLGDNGCFTHRFDNTFNDVFSTGGATCGGMQPWVQESFSSDTVPPFHPYSGSFIRPATTHSCTYSVPFAMANGGFLKFNVYMDLRSSLDQIRILAYDDSGRQVGEFTSTIAHDNFLVGWNVFDIEIDGSDNDNFQGYVAISGRAAADTNILVDSLQFVPPADDSDDPDVDRCDPIYPTVVYQCIEFSFEQGYQMIFYDDHEICTNSESWEANDDVSGIRPKGVGTPSCTSTPIFTVPSTGKLEVNVLIDSSSYFDTILIAMNDDKDNFHSVAHNRLVTDNFQSGDVHTLELKIEHIQREYDGQITFVGFATEGATVAVKSFKFTPESWDKQDCKSLWDTRRRVVVGK